MDARNLVTRAELEEVQSSAATANLAVANAVNSLGAGAMGGPLHQPTAKCIKQIAMLRESIKQVEALSGMSAPDVLKDELKAELKKYNLLGVVAAKGQQGLQVLQHMQESEFFDEEAHKIYREQEKLLDRDGPAYSR
jgi:hypothetical protein